MSFSIVYGDILDYKADAIVMPANPKPVIGKGLDSYIYRKAGKNRLLAARKNIGNIDFGEAESTSAFDLDYKYIIHTVPPAWNGGSNDEEKLLRHCYEESLKIAFRLECKSIIFPVLATGVLRYPFYKAIEVAKSVCGDSSCCNNVDIKLVIYRKIKDEDVDQYIIENTFDDYTEENYADMERICRNLPQDREEQQILQLLRKKLERKRLVERHYAELQKKQTRKKQEPPVYSYMKMSYVSFSTPIRSNVEKFIEQETVGPSFSEVLDKYKELKNIKSYAEIAHKGLLKESTLSRIRSEDINMTRDYVWSIAVGLGLNLKETEELFEAAGFYMRGYYRKSKMEIQRELALEYFIANEIYDIYEINGFLYRKQYPLLGNDISEKDAS